MEKTGTIKMEINPQMEKIGAIKMEINHGGLIDALLCKEEPSIWRMPARVQCEVELQIEIDRAQDGRLERKICDIARRLPRASLRSEGAIKCTSYDKDGIERPNLTFMFAHP